MTSNPIDDGFARLPRSRQNQFPPAESFRRRPSDLNQTRNGMENHRQPGFFNNLLVRYSSR